MELTIDIPEEQYNDIVKHLTDNDGNYAYSDFNLREIIRNGTPYNPTVDITEEQAIDKLHKTGWLPMHDKEMTERPQGEWVVQRLQNGFDDVYCPFCNARPTKSEYGYYLKDKFCHECGADMRGGAE